MGWICVADFSIAAKVNISGHFLLILGRRTVTDWTLVTNVSMTEMPSMMIWTFMANVSIADKVDMTGWTFLFNVSFAMRVDIFWLLLALLTVNIRS